MKLITTNNSRLLKFALGTAAIGAVMILGIGLWMILGARFSGVSWNEILLIGDQPHRAASVGMSVGFILILIGTLIGYLGTNRK